MEFSLARWIKFTFLGWLLGVFFVILLSSILDSIGIEGMQFYVGIGMALGVSCMQWFATKHTLRLPATWIVSSVVGMGIPFIAFDFLIDSTSTYRLPMSVTMGSIVVALLQWQLLRSQFVYASSWFIGCVSGWTAAALSVLIINYTMMIKVAGVLTLVMAIVNLLLILSGGIILGYISGLSLRSIIAKSNTIPQE